MAEASKSANIKSVEELQRLLTEKIPGWDKIKVGLMNDPENVRTPKSVLDSLIYAHGDEPAYMNIQSKRGLSNQVLNLLEGLVKGRERHPRASYSRPADESWNPVGFLREYILDQTGRKPYEGKINASTLDDVIAELSHDIQYKDPKYKAARGERSKYKKVPSPRHLNPFLPDSSYVPYETEGALEHEAHSIIQPIIEDLLFKQKILYKNKVSEEWDKLPFPKESIRTWAQKNYPGWRPGLLSTETRLDMKGLPFSEYLRKALIEDEPITKQGTATRTYYK